MDSKELIEISKNQLTMVLSFFSRTDTMVSILFSVNTAMLALLAANAPPMRALEGYMFFAFIPVGLIAASLYHLYQAAFPQLEGGGQSLIYFREIAGRTESKFVDEFMQQSGEEYIKDVLRQVWRNSEILKRKFNHLKAAFVILAWSVFPWAIALMMFAAKNNELKNIIAK